MGQYTDLLKADPTDWLLEENDPSVRYFALKDLLDLPENDPTVVQAREDSMRRGLVPDILSKQSDAVYRQTFDRYYTNKYKGLVWSLITLAELGAQPNDQIKEQCAYLLTNAQDKAGGFSQHMSKKQGGGLTSEVIPCLTGNMVWCMLRMEYMDDPRVWKGLSFLTTFMRYNDGVEEDPQVPPYAHYESCWGKHTCHMGVVKALKAFSALPHEKRTPAIQAHIQKASEFMLLHRIYKSSHTPAKTAKHAWLKFGFPMMYQTDALEILDILLTLGIHDERMQDALQVVRNKQQESGRWLLENSYCSDRLIIPIGEAGTESKWITLRAMRVLKRAYAPYA